MFALLVTLCFSLVSAGPFEPDYTPRLGFPIDGPWSKIVGGAPASERQFPYQVSLQFGQFGMTRHFCGGSIISSRWVMTAAHCPKALPSYGSFVVKAGKLKLHSTESHEQVVKVQKAYVNERYAGGVGPFDIAMLLLEKPLQFNEYVQPIALPDAAAEHTGEVTLSGWGSVTPKWTEKFTIPDNLQYIELPLVEYEECKHALDAIIQQNPLHPTNVCTGPLTGGKSPCAGDSGGPLVQMNHKTKKLELVGVVSWGIVPCGYQGAPAVYTKTSAHSDWIALTMSNE